MENFPIQEDPPLVSVKVTNPITYLKLWWKEVIGNEGVEMKFKIKPLTALLLVSAVTFILTGTGFSLGRISIPITNPIVKYVPQLAPVITPTPDPWRETAMS